MMAAGITLAAGGLLLVIATQWDSSSESSQRVADDRIDPAPAPDAWWLGCRVSAWSGKGAAG